MNGSSMQSATENSPAPLPAGKRTWLVAEFALLCLALPTLIITYRLAADMLLFLWGACLYCAVIYAVRFHRNGRALWRWDAFSRENLRVVLVRFVIVATAMTAFLYLYDPQRMLELPRERPGLMLVILLLYPVLSALPQEFIFCTFFFDRFRPLFPAERTLILASAVVFAYAHVLFINPVAPVLSFIAGLIFASTYAKTRSLALVTFEHALYGGFLFFIGLGWYFYGGSVAQG